MRNAAVIGQRGKIEELSGPACAQFQEALKSAQILYLDQLPDIAFEISTHIVSMPRVWFESAVEDGGVRPIKEYLIEIFANFS